MLTISAYNQRGAKVEWKQLLATAKDPKTYMYAMCQSASVLGVGVVGSFLPIFINDFGYSPRMTLRPRNNMAWLTK